MSQPPRRGPVIPASSGAKPTGGARLPGGTGPGRGPAPRPARPLPVSSGGGGGLPLVVMLLMLAGMVFCYSLAFTGEPVDAKVAAPGSAVPNMQNLLAVGLSSGRNLTISEAEINGYLAATLQARQGGSLAGKAALRRVVVRLRDGFFQVVLVRELFGREHTVAVSLTPSVTQANGKQNWLAQPTGGRIGKLPVAGQLTKLVLKPVFQLGAIYPKEMKILQQASSIRVENERVLLGPLVVAP